MTGLLSTLAGDAEIEALLSDAAQLDAMLAVERALAAASADAGFISEAAASAIAAAIDRFTPDHGDLATGMARDGVVVPALVAQLRAAVPEAHRPALHKGATSQDIVDTALMLQAARVLDLVETRLAALLDRLSALKSTDGGRPLMAHTRMQAALATTWADKLRAWSEPLARQLRALQSMRRGLHVIQLGGPVGDRRSFDGKGDAIAAALARRLDLGLATPWHTARDPIVALASHLALVTGSLGKIGADIALLAQTEVRAVALKGGGTSSAMAHKSNPVAAEVLVALARYNAGLAGTLQQAMVHEYERSGAAWTLEWLTLPQVFVTTGAALRHALALLDQIILTDGGA
jgi:3-carboxy-cis,cis-muconate cycloisomerase